MGKYVYWKKLFTFLNYSLYQCKDCGAYYIRHKKRGHFRIWGESCSKHSYGDMKNQYKLYN